MPSTATRIRKPRPWEVSFTKLAANKRFFLFHKSADKGARMQTDEAVKKCMAAMEKPLDSKRAQAVAKCISNLTVKKSAVDAPPELLPDEAQAAMAGAARILAPYGGALTRAHIMSLLDTLEYPDAPGDAQANEDPNDQPADPDAGEETVMEEEEMLDPDDAATPENEAEAEPTVVPELAADAPDGIGDDDHAGAMQAANEAYHGALATKGYKVTKPGGEMAKSGDDDKKDPPAPDKVADKEPTPMTKHAKPKDDAAFSAAQQALLDAAIKRATAELVQKNADIEKVLRQEREARQHAEFIQRAQELGALGKADDLVPIFKSVAGNKEASEKLTAIFKSANKQLRAAQEFGGNLYGEIGSSHGSDANGDTPHAKLKALANGLVQKHAGAKKLTQAQAFAQAVASPEGKQILRDDAAQARTR